MINKLQLFFFYISIIIASGACIQIKGSVSNKTQNNKTSYAIFVTDLQQTTLPGRPVAGEEPQTTHRYIIVWNSTTKPETFFWKDGNTWLPCKVSKISNYSPSSIDDKNPYTDIYTSKEVSMYNIKDNDTLELAPYAGGKFPIPQDLPQSSPNTIFYKAEKTNWLTLPITNTTELPDIIMQ